MVKKPKSKRILKHKAKKWPRLNRLMVFVATFALVASILLIAAHAASPNANIEPDKGTITAPAVKGTDVTASNGSYVQFKKASSGLSCTNPVYTGTWPAVQYPGTTINGVDVGGDIQTGGNGTTDMQTLNVCSETNWNVVANFQRNNGSINSYPDTTYTLTGDKTVPQYSSLQTCFGNQEPIPTGPQFPTPGGSEWDYAYDVWLNFHTGENIWANDIEIMVWNDWTDTSYYPPAGSRAVTIDGVAYHMFRGGGANEWIYTRDTRTTSGCFDMLSIMKDLANNGGATTVDYQGTPGSMLSTSGMTNNASLQHLEYGVEISATYGTQTFQITNASLTVH